MSIHIQTILFLYLVDKLHAKFLCTSAHFPVDIAVYMCYNTYIADRKGQKA